MSITRQTTELEYRERINRVIRYMHEHLDDPMNLNVLASVAGFSPYHFHRIFAAFVGEPVGEYIRRMRLERAAHQLRDSDLAVTQIALDAGYETPSAFTKAFKVHFGISPTEFRTTRGVHPLSTAERTMSTIIKRRSTMKPEIRVCRNEQPSMSCGAD